MSIVDVREVYKPFEYNQAYIYTKMQRSNFWEPSEVSMMQDIADWNRDLTESERLIIGQILKSFTQTEVHVNKYWSQNVSKWFPKPEIQAMCSTFSAFEGIHAEGYDYLNVELGLEDYEAFMQDKTAMDKLDRLKEIKGDNLSDIAKSLAIFSAFTEGVSLFSSFSLLSNLSRFGLLKGVKNIIEWSQIDESVHSAAGCWLFRTLIDENPHLFTDQLKKDIYDAARLTVELEDKFIDNAFSLGEMRGLNAQQLKAFVRDRTNKKLVELGLKANWKNIDKKLLSEMSWFDNMSNAVINTDFFSSRVTEYAKVKWKMEDLF